MGGALFYYEWHSRWNRVRTRLARLRQPKYLVGAVVGGLYFYFYVFTILLRQRHRGGTPLALSAEHRELAQSLAGLALLVVLLLMWIIPHGRAALAFTEAEVAFLFPAPVGRRALINFKLLKSQVAILFSAVFFALIRSWGGGQFFWRALGWWVVLCTVNLHLLVSSFARTLLLDRGISNQRRRVIFLGAVGLAVFGIVQWARRSLPAPPDFNGAADISVMADYTRQVLQTGPALWLLAPFRWVVAPMFAQDAGTFFIALGPALAIIGLHYWWVMRANVAFEEASLELSRKHAELRAAVRSGHWQAAGSRPKKGKRAPFELRPVGWPAAAIFWKNLISAGYFFSWRIWIWLVWAVSAGMAMQSTMRHSSAGLVVAFIALMLVLMSLMSGPQLLRYDFRQDLRAGDVLKMYPMPPWQVVLGEILAPAAILAAAQWLLLLVAGIFLTRVPGDVVVPVSWRIGLGLAAALVLPLVDFLALLLPNAAALIFPAWALLGRNTPRGFETMGQQIILMVAQVLVMALALLPAAMTFGVIYFVSANVIGIGTLPALDLAAMAAVLPLAGEAVLGVWLLGKAFERYDWSEGMAEG